MPSDVIAVTPCASVIRDRPHCGKMAPKPFRHFKYAPLARAARTSRSATDSVARSAPSSALLQVQEADRRLVGLGHRNLGTCRRVGWSSSISTQRDLSHCGSDAKPERSTTARALLLSNGIRYKLWGVGRRGEQAEKSALFPDNSTSTVE